MSHLAHEAAAKFPLNLADDRLDHHAWHKRIMYRYERGDKTLLAVQIQFAREASGEKLKDAI
jgi:hypothetical protein